MATRTFTVKAYGDPKIVVQTYSDTPNIKDGTTIACFKLVNSATPVVEDINHAYANGDDVKVVLDGAKQIKKASVNKATDGSVVATAESATTGPAGLAIATGAIATAVELYVFIVYTIETGG